MTTDGSPTVRRRRLGIALRQLREARKLTADQVIRRLADELDSPWSNTKISRLEGGHLKKPNPRDIRDLLDVYEVTDEHERRTLIELAKEAGKRGWWTEYDDVFISPMAGFEAEASSIRTFEPVFVPGLLQSEDYARAIFRAGNRSAAPDEIDRRIAARLARRQILERDEPPKLWAVIDEGALRRPVGGVEAMRAQLDRLVEIGGRSNVTLQILPTAVGAQAGMFGAFSIFDFPDPTDKPIVYLETATDALHLERPEQIESYVQRFDDLRAEAEGFEKSAELIARIKTQLE